MDPMTKMTDAPQKGSKSTTKTSQEDLEHQFYSLSL